MEVNSGADLHLQPMEVNSGADLHLQPTEDPAPEQVDAPEGGCDPLGSCTGAAPGRTCGPMESCPGWSRFAGRACESCRGSTLEQFVKNCILWEGLMLEKIIKDSPMGGTPHRNREEFEEEEAAEMCGELTATAIPYAPVLLWGRRWRKSGVTLSLGRREDDGGEGF